MIFRINYKIICIAIFFSFLLSCKKERIDNQIQQSNLIFNSNLKYGTVKDSEGNTYKTIQIGTQVWMAENLKTTKYNDGTSIALIPAAAKNLKDPGCCYYNDDISYKNDYGVLYNGYAVNSKTNGNKSVCPIGWHLPSCDEWEILLEYVRQDESDMRNNPVKVGKLKEEGITHWSIPTIYSTNSSGFTAVPGGIRNAGFSPLFEGIGTMSFYWCSEAVKTDASPSFSIFDFEWEQNYSAFDYSLNNGFFFSVRCIKD